MVVKWPAQEDTHVDLCPISNAKYILSSLSSLKQMPTFQLCLPVAILFEADIKSLFVSVSFGVRFQQRAKRSDCKLTVLC